MVCENKKPLVSILLNCFNASLFISRAIRSVINQSYTNWELIIWDDGSTDSTVNEIKKFKDQRIKFFSQKKNSGLCLSRINAVEKINGSLVSVLDADDFFEPEKISKQVEIFNKDQRIAICSTWVKFFNENLKLTKIFESNLNNEELKHRLLLVNILPHSSLMYKKSAAQKVGWYSNNFEYSQDFDLTLKLLKKNEIYLIKEHLTNIIQTQSNMSNSVYYKKIRIEENLQILKNNLKTLNFTSKDAKLLESLIQINLIKLALLDVKKNLIKSLYLLMKFFIKNPLIILKLKLVSNLSEIKKV